MKSKLTFAVLLLLSSCANITMPTGGPRDETPPELVTSNPNNNQLNFNERLIELTFNEDIKLKDPKEEFIIIPSIGKNTDYSVKKKKLFIEPELEWQPNTTYSINFREGVQDITEGNPAENLRIAFSTGPVIDSLSINGNIVDTFSEKVPNKITIALYQQDTFDIFKHTPIYFTKSDKDGKYNIPNLKAGNYFIYAFDDKNKNLKVDSKTEKFGFMSSEVNLPEQKDSIAISITLVDSRPLTITSVRHTDKTSRLRFNKQLDSLVIKGLTADKSIYSYGSDKSELIFYNSFPKEDSIQTHLIGTDSVGQRVDTTFYIKYGEVKAVEETFRTKEIKVDYNVPTRILTYTLGYNIPIGSLNKDSIYIKYDSLNIKHIEEKDIIIDTLNNQLTIKSIIEPIGKEQNKKPNPPALILGIGALITINQDSSKRIFKSINILTEEDLGTVVVKIETSEKNYIAEVITMDNKVVQSIKNIKDYTFKNLEPKEYKLRILVDKNNNGRWDAGNFNTKKEAEKIILYKSEEGKYNIILRANWEYGPVLIKF